jgi:hypothetical protein
MFHELLSRDHETGNPLAGLSGASANKMGVPARHRERSGEAGGPPGNRRVLVSVPERYVAG